MNEVEFFETLNIYFKNGDYRCVVEALTDEYRFDDNKNRCFTSSENCSECISKWMQEILEKKEKQYHEDR